MVVLKTRRSPVVHLLLLVSVWALSAGASAEVATNNVVVRPRPASSSTSLSRRRHSGRLLGKPNPIKCLRRPRQILDKASGHYYFFSEDTKFQVSIETAGENEMLKMLIKQRNLREVWTSGRLCNFQGCNKPHLLPRHIKDHAVPQPDNAEYLLNPSLATVEACLAIHNNWYGDGLTWHDVACYRKKPFICEDSEVLMRRARALNPSVRL